MRILGILLCAQFISTATLSQDRELQNELAQITAQLSRSQWTTQVQHFRFYIDSASAPAFDSGDFNIQRHDTLVHTEFNGVESFSDGVYLVRVSKQAKYMLISKAGARDRADIGSMLAEGILSFKSTRRDTGPAGLSTWQMSDGAYGVRSCRLVLDTNRSRISSIVAELASDHPFISSLVAAVPKRPQSIIVMIEYEYDIAKSAMPSLSDFCIVQDGRIGLAEKYRDYQLRIIQ
jgi:hypothetical protein